MKIFLSHSHFEAKIAQALESWLVSQGIECFCASQPKDLRPTDKWFDRILQQARDSEVIILLLSRYSLANQWMFYEAGIFEGMDKPILPLLFSGAQVDKLPTMYGRHQAAQIAHVGNSAAFDAFCSEILKMSESNSSQSFMGSFLESLDSEQKRVLEHGMFGGFQVDANTVKNESRSEKFKNETQPIFIPRRSQSGDGEMAAVRVKFMPRPVDAMRHWKFGLALTTDATEPNPHNEIFMFHANCENSISSWSLYKDRVRVRPYNIPAQLQYDKWCTLSLWLRENGTEVYPLAIDSNHEIIHIRGRAEDGFWNLVESDWKFLKIKAWNDDERHNGLPVKYQFDVEWEVDRV